MSERMSACTIECVRGCEQASARGLPQSSLESAFSGVYRVFQRVRAPKRARPPTEQPGECGARPEVKCARPPTEQPGECV